MSQLAKMIIKYLTSIAGTLFFGVVAIVVFLHYSFKDMCGNEIYEQIDSPNKKYKAIVFQRDCGSTTGFSSQISIVKYNKDLPNKSGNIFTASGHPDQNSIKCVWLTENRIEITENISEAFLKENNFQDIEIVYKK